jgi:cell division protein FtsB
MTRPRIRRTAPAAGSRRTAARPLVRAASRPLPSVDRLRVSSHPAARRAGRRRLLPRRAHGGDHRPLLTGRAVLLGALVLLLALTLTGPVRQWLAGREQIDQLAAERSSLDAQVRDLQAQLRRQSDPAYVARQARERLTYVLPGDRLVVVVDGTTVRGDTGTAVPAPGRTGTRPPWYDGLLQSLATADGTARSAGR